MDDLKESLHKTKPMSMFLVEEPQYNLQPPSPSPYPLLVKAADSKEEMCGHRLLGSQLNNLAGLAIGLNLNMSAGYLWMGKEIDRQQETLDAMDEALLGGKPTKKQ